MTAKKIEGKKVAILVEDGFEQIEFTSPRDACAAAGADVRIISPAFPKVQGWNHDEKGDVFPVDSSLADADPNEFDALILPGGVRNPDKLRRNEKAQVFVKAMFDAGKPIAAICHGPWTLIDAGVVNNRKMTSYHTLQTDLKNAGADWVDEEVVVDQGLVTSRNPDDLDAFNKKVVEEIAEGRHMARLAG